MTRKMLWLLIVILIPLLACQAAHRTTVPDELEGKDGKSKPPLTAKESWDDIVRANDGGYVGLASQY